MPIRRLPSLLVNQIAAGEVIERPANVVKELIENSIDAEATQIDVAIENGGCELIRVSDNGCGIPIEELELAVSPHATSKIEDADDLNAIATLGFRGEALASIASVSRMSIVSRTNNQNHAGQIEAEGDKFTAPKPIGGSVGTVVTVRNLFFNTPARRKFLRTEVTEGSRVSEVVENMAMSHPAIGFTFSVDGKKRFEFPTTESSHQRVLAVIGPELADELLEFELVDRGIELRGLAGKPEIARGTAKHQRVFLNGRLITDRTITHAIKEAYRGLIEPNRYPTVVLFLTVDPSLVDVNVHPTKAEVRFRSQSNIHGAVLSSIRDSLRKADLTPGLELRVPEFAKDFGASNLHRAESSHQESTKQFVEYFRRLDPKQKGFVYSEVKQALASESPEVLREEVAQGQGISVAAQELSELPTVRAVENIMQVHSSYIVTQDADGLLIFDQHALHERVMFEKLKSRVEVGTLESQRLLTPVTIEADQSRIDALEALQPLLTKLGIEANPMGPKSIAVQSFTSLLFERGVDPVTFMTELLEKAVNESLKENAEALLHETLDMMACKAAIKAGDRLTEQELNELLKYRDTVERSSNCPHGRPTTLRLSMRDLDRQFGRR